MISASCSRAAVRPNGFLALVFLLIFSCAPKTVNAKSPQSADAPPAQKPPVQDAAKKDSAGKTSDEPTPKANPPKPHRVFTNDDFSSGSNSSIPIAPGARRRVKQLNRCDRTCFNEVKKQALGWGYTTAYPRSTREEMDDRLANDIEELHSNPKWQRLLLELVSAHIDSCAMRQKNAAAPNDTPPHTPTRAEILEEEERMKHPSPAPPNNYNSAGSALLAYRFNTRPDPLKASLMVHEYMDELHQDCATAYAPQDSPDDSADDSDP